jgi:hypothetical protein
MVPTQLNWSQQILPEIRTQLDAPFEQNREFGRASSKSENKESIRITEHSKIRMQIECRFKRAEKKLAPSARHTEQSNGKHQVFAQPLVAGRATGAGVAHSRSMQLYSLYLCKLAGIQF